MTESTASKKQTVSVTLSKEAADLIKAEALKDDRSVRSWLDRYIRATLPLSSPAQKTTEHTWSAPQPPQAEPKRTVSNLQYNGIPPEWEEKDETITPSSPPPLAPKNRENMDDIDEFIKHIND